MAIRDIHAEYSPLLRRFHVLPGYENRLILPFLTATTVLLVITGVSVNGDDPGVSIGQWGWATGLLGLLMAVVTTLVFLANVNNDLYDS